MDMILHNELLYESYDTLGDANWIIRKEVIREEIKSRETIWMWFKKCFWIGVAKFTAKRLHSLNSKLVTIVEGFDDYSITHGKDGIATQHKLLVKLLDFVTKDINQPTLNHALTVADGNVRPIVQETISFLDLAKSLEMKSRLFAYPELNKVHFTYDQMKELQETFKDSTPTEEEFGTYSLK